MISGRTRRGRFNITDNSEFLKKSFLGQFFISPRTKFSQLLHVNWETTIQKKYFQVLLRITDNILVAFKHELNQDSNSVFEWRQEIGEWRIGDQEGCREAEQSVYLDVYVGLFCICVFYYQIEGTESTASSVRTPRVPSKIYRCVE